ncbi:MAG: HAD family acid phosphatase [Planctomycetota bacterium]|nr:HAD family acid phosphatase [Planctomycetota bacterium]
MRFSFLAIISVFLLGQEATGQHPATADPQKDPKLNALLWVQNSAEYRVLTEQTYRFALLQLKAGLKDKTWSADEIPAKENNYQEKTPAVILDVDETVLDNSAFNARNVLDGTTYNLESWNAWAQEEKARAVPGALEFIQAAKKMGVAIFYITNRRDTVRAATLNNLEALGFPVDAAHLLTRNDDLDRAGDKVSRRKSVASQHRILLLIGDNLADVCSGMDTDNQNDRNRMATQRALLRSRWILLPNPVYGGWERALDPGSSNLDVARKPD